MVCLIFIHHSDVYFMSYQNEKSTCTCMHSIEEDLSLVKSHLSLSTYLIKNIFGGFGRPEY